MDQKQKNSLGVGVMVGVIFFYVHYTGWFGIGPGMDLVGSMGVGFGSGFSASIISYMMSRDEGA